MCNMIERMHVEMRQRDVKDWPTKSQNRLTESNMPLTDIEGQDIQASLSGDGDAYRRIVERYQQRVARIMNRFTRDAGKLEELVQDVFVEAYFSLKTYKGKAPLEHWLARIATHVGYRFWQVESRRKKQPIFQLEDWDGGTNDRMEGMDADEAARYCHMLLAHLPPRDRLVLTLRYLEGCDVAETARRTGWSESLVKVQSHRARAKLRKTGKRLGLEVIL